MKINCEYQRYCGFRIIPRELQFGYGYTCDGLRCVRVCVRYGKIPPVVYPCSTLVVGHGHGWGRRCRRCGCIVVVVVVVGGHGGG